MFFFFFHIPSACDPNPQELWIGNKEDYAFDYEPSQNELSTLKLFVFS